MSIVILPCQLPQGLEVGSGHYFLNGGVLCLKQVAASPESLGEAHRMDAPWDGATWQGKEA